MFLGHGNLLNGAVPLNQAALVDQKIKADAHYVGPSGSHLGAGRILNDGTLDRNQSN